MNWPVQWTQFVLIGDVLFKLRATAKRQELLATRNLR